MNGLNRIFLMGHLGSAPQNYPTKNGRQYTSLNVATNRYIGNDDGGRPKTVTDWHYVRVWGTAGENCMKFLDKGSHVFIEGYLSQYSRPKEDGKPDRRTAINANRVDFLPRTMREALADSRPLADSSEEVDENLEDTSDNGDSAGSYPSAESASPGEANLHD